MKNLARSETIIATLFGNHTCGCMRVANWYCYVNDWIYVMKTIGFYQIVEYYFLKGIVCMLSIMLKRLWFISKRSLKIVIYLRVRQRETRRFISLIPHGFASSSQWICWFCCIHFRKSVCFCLVIVSSGPVLWLFVSRFSLYLLTRCFASLSSRSIRIVRYWVRSFILSLELDRQNESSLTKGAQAN